MSEHEFYENRKLLTDKEKIRWQTLPRKNLLDFPNDNVYIQDTLSLVPRNNYSFTLKLISQSSSKEMSAIISIPYGKGEVIVDENKSKGGVFWFSEEHKRFDLTVKTHYGKVRILYALKELDHLGHWVTFERGSAMGMKIEELSESKKIYHCTEQGLPADFEKLVFSVEWHAIK